jgi:uncharacterized protein YndB with AHSA1/START domain
MEKYKFVAEYELKSSPKVLFPYFSTASGLEQWLAEKVIILPDQSFDIQWDGESHFAQLVSHRLNKAVKFEFIGSAAEEENRNYIEFRLDVSDLTHSTYLKVIDYSSNTDEQELISLWDGFIDRLKEIVGK